MDLEDDPDLLRAIEMSLQECSAPNSTEKPRAQIIIDLTSSDEEDDDLDAPVSRKQPTSLKKPKVEQSRSTHVSNEPRQPVKKAVVDLIDDEDTSFIDVEVVSNRHVDLSTRPTDMDKFPVVSSHQEGPSIPSSTHIAGVAKSSREDQDIQSGASSNKGIKQPTSIFVPEVPEKINGEESSSSSGSATSNLPAGTGLLTQKIDPLVSIMPSIMQGLDRRKMEEERLARVNQRKKREEIIVPSANQSRKRKSSKSPSNSPEATPRTFKRSSILDTNRTSGSLLPKTARVGSSGHEQYGIQFPNGTVKKTWAFGCVRENDIKIEENYTKIMNSTLQLAVLSAFQVDPDWVATKINRNTKVVWVLQAKTSAEKDNIKSNAPENYRFCFPNMDGQINCMHSKLQLLAHPTHLRIVIPSANLVPYDWGETGVMENTCFIIDLPRLPQSQSTQPVQLTDFGKELLYFVKRLGLDNGDGLSIGKSLTKFDFSGTSKLAFIHSIGGSHGGSDWERTGYCGLGSAVRRLGLQSNDQVNINFVSASIGNLTLGFAKAIYLAAKGDNGLIELDWRTSSAKKAAKKTIEEREVEANINNGFRIYFPTRDTVASSIGGVEAGGTICFQSKWYDATSFPRQLMRDCKSTRGGLLMHNKMLFCKPNQASGGKGWVYIGSANLSESAWGHMSKDKSTKTPKLNLRNCECGVIVPSEMAVVPMVVPGEEYGSKRPWFFMDRI